MRAQISLLSLVCMFLLLAGCSKENADNQITIAPLDEPLMNEDVKDPFEGAPMKVIAVRAFRFAFDPNIIEVTEGDHVKLTVTSLDVGHGFALPDFGINKKVPPEESVTIDFLADKTGEFEFFSSVYSGKGYKDMRGKFVVSENPEKTK